MNFDPLEYPYPSRRSLNYSRKGMVATSQPLATQSGLDILKKGGNAVDAAVATAASLTVLEPTSNGIGGDGFAIVWMDGDIHGLNSSGPSPESIDIETVKEKGHEEMPKFGWIPVTVPGIPGAWSALSERFGELPLTEVLEPAIEYAEEGYPVSPILGKYWQAAYDTYKEEIGGKTKFENWFDTFAPKGRAPEIGEIWRSTDHAQTLKEIGETGADSFYKGELAEKMIEFSKETGGYLSEKDLAGFSPEWVDPLNIDYRGHEVWELPPNGQGMIALQALKILKGFDFDSKDSIETYHKQIEALKLAFSDGKNVITDPDHMSVDPEDILSEDYAAEKREMIGEEAIEPEPGRLAEGGTVYLAAADKDGNMVSYIQSNYMGFGSGLVVPETGIALQNRGNTFSLDSSHPNCLEPSKRTYHTIIPGFLTRDGDAVGPFGVMGGYMQPQGHLQVVMNTLDFDLNPQSALDAPRWRWHEDKKVYLEKKFPHHIGKALSRRGHDIQYSLHSGSYGRGEIIWKMNDGVYAGGTEPRTDGHIASW
ncbi:MAG: gamma-glutamyltransferase family protein [Candidatus Thermoplasmatota archaeon]|nr:gamma-glutamyltransferase family protein [Candidatus Thermoplasmatota archaeon]